MVVLVNTTTVERVDKSGGQAMSYVCLCKQRKDMIVFGNVWARVRLSLWSSYIRNNLDRDRLRPRESIYNFHRKTRKLAHSSASTSTCVV